MIQLKLDMPEGAFSSLRRDPDGFGRELRLAAAVKWYELGRVSQERAAQIADLSRAAFLDALGRLRVTPFQVSGDELVEEALRDQD